LLHQAQGMVMLPSGDFQDLRLIDGQNATKVKSDELTPMFARYGVREVIIAAMTVGHEGTMEPTKILLHRVGVKRIREEVIELAPESAEEKTDSRIAAAARAIASAALQIASSADEEIQEKLAAAAKIKLHFVYATPKDLSRMTELIRGAPDVLLLELPTITLSKVHGVIYLGGKKDSAALRTYLVTRGMVIREQGEEWTVSTR